MHKVKGHMPIDLASLRDALERWVGRGGAVRILAAHLHIIHVTTAQHGAWEELCPVP
jgi:hypothetical protein